MLFQDSLNSGESNAGALEVLLLVEALEWREIPICNFWLNHERVPALDS